jgi:hypothetical protein
MSLREFLTREGREERSLRNCIKTATNKHAQSEDRMVALEKLRSTGTEEALYGLLSRFGFVYDKSISDEAEKEFVFESMSSLPAERALAPLQRYLRNADSIAWPLRVLHRVASPDQVLAVVTDLCERNSPEYTRDPSKKIQIVHFCGDEEDHRLAGLVVPYLEDVDEGVRFACVEALLKHRQEAASKEPLVRALARPEEDSLRLRRRIAEALAELGWDLSTLAEAAGPALTGALPDGFSIDKGGKLARKSA